MKNDGNIISRPRNRRSFLKTGLAAAGAATMGTGLLARATAALRNGRARHSLTRR